MLPAIKAAPQLIIKRPDGTETRFVRRKPRPVQTSTDADLHRDEDRDAVAACPPYTASFNSLLEERKEKNSRVFISAVLERMHAEAIPLNVVTYNLLMERVVCLPEDIIFNLYDEMREEAVKDNSSVQPNLKTYQLLFRACERKGQYNRAFLFYKQMRDLMHIVPDSPTYDTLLGFCAAVKDVAQAAYFMEEMKRTGVTADADTYNCLMSVLVDSAPYEETRRVFQEISNAGVRPTIRTYNTVIRAACTHGDYDRAFQLFEEIKKSGMLPDVVTYNTLLTLVEQRLDYVMGCGVHAGVRRSWEQRWHGCRAIAELALTLFAEMESLHIMPNTYTFNQTIAVLLRAKSRAVFRVYSALCAAAAAHRHKRATAPGPGGGLGLGLGLGADTDTETGTEAGTGTAAGSRVGRGAGAVVPSLDEAMGFEDPRCPARVAARQAQPNRDTYRLLVRACLAFGYARRCEGFYRAMRRDGLTMDHDFAILMQTVCETTGDTGRALELLHEAKDARVLIDAPLYNAYLNVLASRGDEQLPSLLHDMQLGISSFNVKADVASCNAALRGYVCRGDYAGAEALFASMYIAYSRATPDTETYCWMIRVYRQKGNTDAAIDLIHSMRQRQVIALVHYHELMRLYLEAGDERVVETFRMLCAGDITSAAGPIHVDAECYCIVLEYYLRQGRWEELRKLFAELKANSEVEIDVGCYNVVLEMLLAQYDVQEASLLFEELCTKCIPLTIETYNTLLRIFAPVGHLDMYAVLEEMKKNSEPPAESTLGILMEYAEGRRVISEAVERDLFWNPTTDFTDWPE